MKSSKIFTAIFIIMVIISIPVLAYSKPNLPVAQKGVMDLSSWDFDKDGTVNLSGEWELYYGDFISQKTMDNAKKQFISLPTDWGSVGKPQYGYATHRLKIKLPSNVTEMAMNFYSPASAFEIWANGEKIYTGGKIASKREDYQPFYAVTSSSNAKYIQLNAQNGVIDLSFYVSNFDIGKGGIRKNIEFGTQKQIKNTEKYYIALDLFNSGCLVIIFIHYLNFYLLRTRDKGLLYLSILALCGLVRTLSCGEVYM
jgi:hypothetical protein